MYHVLSHKHWPINIIFNFVPVPVIFVSLCIRQSCFVSFNVAYSYRFAHTSRAIKTSLLCHVAIFEQKLLVSLPCVLGVLTPLV